MITIKDTFSEIYKNKDIHWGLFAIVLVGAILSTIYDIRFGKTSNHKQNIVDSIFSLYLSACSIQFLYNIIHKENNGEIPLLKNIKLSLFLKLIIVKIIWGVIGVVTLIPFILILYFLFNAFLVGTAKIIVIACIIGLMLAMLSAFFPYINITLANTLEIGEAVNPLVIIRAIGKTAGKTYAQFFKYLGISLLFFIAAVICYALAEFAKLGTLLQISENVSVIDILIHGIGWYVLFVIWSLMYPYSLLETYKENIAPFEEQPNENY